MSQEVELSIMAPNANGIQPLLDQFEAETQTHVRLRLLAWDSAWSILVRSALYGDGPDISEIGTTWTGDLVGMNALRLFDSGDVASFRKGSSFFPASWKTASPYGDANVWAIPWLVGARQLYYRKEPLERAGIDPQSAFTSIEHLDHTVARLQAVGVKAPITLPTGFTHSTLLNCASWVWAAGGEFVSPNGKSALFMEPAALAGLRSYFSLGRFLAPHLRHLNGLEPDEKFLSDPETAITISTPYVFAEACRLGLEDQIGIALPPGPSFVGGSNLVIWKRANNPEGAMKLLRFLMQSEAEVQYSLNVGLLPARIDALEHEPFKSDPMWQVAIHGLKTGRSFPTIRLWGLVEDRLTTGLASVWADMLSNLHQDPEIPLAKHLGPLASRLDNLLGQG